MKTFSENTVGPEKEIPVNSFFYIVNTVYHGEKVSFQQNSTTLSASL